LIVISAAWERVSMPFCTGRGLGWGQGRGIGIGSGMTTQAMAWRAISAIAASTNAVATAILAAFIVGLLSA